MKVLEDMVFSKASSLSKRMWKTEGTKQHAT